MGENNNENKNGLKPATEAQVKLALQLYTETDYARKYSEAELRKLDIETLSVHIAKVKDYKNGKAQLALENVRVNGFNEACFGMLFKLNWRTEDAQYFVHRCVEVGQENAFCELYDTYARIRAAVKKHVQEGGQK